MASYILILINFTLLSAAHDRACKDGANVNRSLIHVGENSLSSQCSSNLTDFIFTLSNSSSFVDVRTKSRPTQVDCFGLGKTLAATLEWFFMSKPNGTDALDVQFLLSSRKQPQRVHVTLGKQFGLEWTDFQMHRKTIIIVHGFLSHGQEPWISDMEKSFLQWVGQSFFFYE